MAEEVSTGGVKKFSYEGGYTPRLHENEKKEIEEAYRRADERRARERRRRNAIIAIVIVIVLFIVAWLLLR